VTSARASDEVARDGDAQVDEQVAVRHAGVVPDGEQELERADDRMVERSECDHRADEPRRDDSGPHRAGCTFDEPRHERHQRARDDAAQEPRPGSIAGQLVGDSTDRVAGSVAENTVTREDDREQRAAGEIQEERDAPELAELQPRSGAALERGDRNEEVLGEELRLPDDDEDEADAERDRIGDAAGVDADAADKSGLRERERNDSGAGT
jgi:hypothetical protein